MLIMRACLGHIRKTMRTPISPGVASSRRTRPMRALNQHIVYSGSTSKFVARAPDENCAGAADTHASTCAHTDIYICVNKAFT